MPETRTATVTLAAGMSFEATSGSGHAVTLDAMPDHGGEDRGPGPTELLLMSLGGCTGMDVIAMLRKMRQEVTAYRVEVRGDRRDEHPRIFTRIEVEHVVRGRGLDPKQVARAVELSATRYCPVSAMLSAAAEVRHTYRVEAADS